MSQASEVLEFNWGIHTQAAALVDGTIRLFTDAVPLAAELQSRMLRETGTRICDWVDHLCLTAGDSLLSEYATLGFEPDAGNHPSLYAHSGGLFPRLRVHDGARRLVIKVESVADFLAAHRLDVTIQGAPGTPLRTAQVASQGVHELWVIERSGCDTFDPVDTLDRQVIAAMRHGEAFTLRQRDFELAEDGFLHAAKLVTRASEDLGVDWACDLFFAAERKYWQSRNLAARIQKDRQDRLGLGWANHDHHTYRSSRQHFTRLIELLEQLGFVCRERFYGGAQAGWGAQVLEQPVTGIVVFADVDLTPEEVMGDFAHEGLEPRSELGTVGLWCKLHGEAILQAGMHHLECQFDFEAARDQLAPLGIETMSPFSDMPHLKQAFTKGEIWQVPESRIDAALHEGVITQDQAERFKSRGSIGSHLELLQRGGGYKGFNQSGISEIIRETDPRR